MLFLPTDIVGVFGISLLTAEPNSRGFEGRATLQDNLPDFAP
jgi:hypothetical protein